MTWRQTTASAGGRSRPSQWPPWSAPLSAALIGVAAFVPALKVGFLADDFDNLSVVRLLSSPAAAFVTANTGEHSGGLFYRPLFVLANAGMVAAFGHNPLPFHALSLLLYAVLVAQVFYLARRFEPAVSPVVAALLFALYSQHEGAVVWYAALGDLLAGVLILAGVLAATSRTRDWRRLLALAVFAMAAALSKETGFLLAPLIVVCTFTRRGLLGSAAEGWREPALVVAVQLPIVLVRTLVLHGLGGYSVPVGPLRVVGSAASFVAGALSPPPLDPITNPWLWIVPAGLLAWVVWAIARSGRDSRLVAMAGIAWFGLSLLPVLNYPFNLSTGNSERYLLLPSIGFVLAVAACIGNPRGLRVRIGLGALGVASAACCLVVSLQWITASTMLDGEAMVINHSSPRGAQVVLLTFVEDYRMAWVTAGGPSLAAAAHREDLTITSCAPLHVLDAQPQQVHVSRAPGGFRVQTSRAAPLRVSVLKGVDQYSPGCEFRPSNARDTLETTLDATVLVSGRLGDPVLLYFDGQSLKPCCAGPAGAP